MASVATKAVWADYAVLTSSRDSSKKWKVQVNDAGDFRCSCPAFIFSKVQPRSCKHTRWAEGERSKPGAATLPPLRLAVAPCWDDAKAIVEAMAVRVRAAVTLSLPVRQVMTEILAARLAAFVPPAVSFPSAAVSGQVGVRMITFEDD